MKVFSTYFWFAVICCTASCQNNQGGGAIIEHEDVLDTAEDVAETIEDGSEEPDTSFGDSLIPGFNGKPLSMYDVIGIYDNDTCFKYLDEQGSLCTFIIDDISTAPYGKVELDEIVGMYPEEAEISYDTLVEENEHVEVNVRDSQIELLCSMAEGCFYYLDMQDSIFDIDGMYIGMSKREFFDLYPNKIGLEDSIDNYTFLAEWMIYLKLVFDADTLSRIYTDDL